MGCSVVILYISLLWLLSCSPGTWRTINQLGMANSQGATNNLAGAISDTAKSQPGSATSIGTVLAGATASSDPNAVRFQFAVVYYLLAQPPNIRTYR
jgi:hypothetical protein